MEAAQSGEDRPQRHVEVDAHLSGGAADSPAQCADARKQREEEERGSLVLWRRPLLTLGYFALELLHSLRGWTRSLRLRQRSVFALTLLLVLLALVYRIEGAHQQYVLSTQNTLFWCCYWLGLGVLSSVGLGTGLHTFLLYLGPHIASVTLAAYECGSVDFPEPPYPEQIICPQAEGLLSGAPAVPGQAVGSGAGALQGGVSLWTIMSKVRLEACMWGAGTAIGELPPYFMARAARLSGADPDNEDYQEFEEMLERDSSAQDLGSRAKLAVQKLIHKVGFLGILACASIPNPLFDLAGITCGHFLVPFWTFFGATLIGKAVIKMHIQKLFVIITFSRHIVEQMVALIGWVPGLGAALQKPFREYLQAQRAKLHHGAEDRATLPEENCLSWLFEKLVVVMVCFFVVSILNSMAQSHAKRRRQQQRLLEAKTK